MSLSRPLYQAKHMDWCGVHRHLVWVYEGKPPVSYLKGRYQHSKITAWLLRRGTVWVQGGGKWVEAGPGTWVFPPYGEDERHFSGDLELLSVCCHAQWPNGHMLFESPHPHGLPSSEMPALERVAMELLAAKSRLSPRSTNQLTYEAMSLRDFLRLERHVPEWLECYAEAMERLGVRPTERITVDARAAKARARLDKQPLDREADTSHLSDLGRSQLDRVFLAAYGMTPRHYLEQRRIEAALGAVQGSHQPIKEIAIGLGFKQYSHFSNWFKKHVGLSPRACRKASYVNPAAP